jgi:hypothetical protein
MASDERLTMSGFTWRDAIGRLKEVLPESAYKAVEGSKFGGTDISPAWLTDKATEIFGPCGEGWLFDYLEDDVVVAKENRAKRNGEVYEIWTAWVKRLGLRIRWGEEYSGEILATGYAEGDNPAYALRGAVTNALGSAFSKLCWQVHIYKGERVERRTGTGTSTSARPIAQAQDERQAQDLPKNGTPRPYAPEKVRDTILTRAKEHAKAKYSDKQRGFMRGGMSMLFAGMQLQTDEVTRNVHSVFAYLFGRDSGKDLNDPQWAALADWLQIKQDSGGELRVSELAVKEAQAILARRLSELGQESLFPSG